MIHNFVKPSIGLSEQEKVDAYKKIHASLHQLLKGEKHNIVKMVTINSQIKSFLPYAYWVGFYFMMDGKLRIGPYQGTLGCLSINVGRGVCGRVAKEKKTVIISDIAQLTEGLEHITCDSNSNSEIALPVYDSKGLMAVLDLDSTLKDSFTEVDKKHLEIILAEYFASSE